LRDADEIELRQLYLSSILDISAAITIGVRANPVLERQAQKREWPTSQSPILPDVCRTTATVRLGIASPPPSAATDDIARREIGRREIGH
jgi:hypothetical protein